MDTNTLVTHAGVSLDTRGRRIRPRRHRSIQEKRAIIAETLVPGASVAEIARAHGVNANLVFVWRRLHEKGLLESHTRRMTGRRLVAVKVLEAAAPLTTGALRIEFTGGMQLHIMGSVDVALVERIIAQLSQ